MAAILVTSSGGVFANEEGDISDFDEATLRRVAERVEQAQRFIDEPRPGQETPSYLRESDFQQGKLCGVNALYICLRILGRTVSYEEVLKSVPIGKRGANMADLVTVAKQHGLEFRALKNVSPRELSETRAPIIAHFNTPDPIGNDDQALDHFVVLVGYDATKHHFHQIDPSACAHMRLSDEYVARSFSGHCLVLEGHSPVLSARTQSTLWYVFTIAGFSCLLSWWAAIEWRARSLARDPKRTLGTDESLAV